MNSLNHESAQDPEHRVLLFEPSPAKKQPSSAQEEISSSAYYNTSKRQRTPAIALLTEKRPPANLVVMVTSRRLEKANPSSLKSLKHVTKVFMGFQFPILCSSSTTAFEVYEHVWMKLRPMLRLSAQTRSSLWWAADKKDHFSPFVLKFVDSEANACALCHWTKKCHGCVLQADNRNIYQDLLSL